LIFIENKNSKFFFSIFLSQDSSPCFKVVSKIFGTGKIKMEYMRLSLPVAFHYEYTPKSITREKRMTALSLYRSQIEEEAESKYFSYIKKFLNLFKF